MFKIKNDNLNKLFSLEGKTSAKCSEFEYQMIRIGIERILLGETITKEMREFLIEHDLIESKKALID